MQTSKKLFKENWLFFGALLISCIIFCYQIPKYFGIEPFDESLYIARAFSQEPANGWSPLYIELFRIYRILAGAWAQPTDLYFLNTILVTSAIPLLSFWTLIRLKVKPTLAFFAGYLLLISMLNAPLFPKASHFNLIWILATFLIANYIKNRFYQLIALPTFLVPTLFIRQDSAILLAFVLMTSIFIWTEFRIKSLALAFLASAFSYLILCFKLGTPFTTQRFAQVFVDNYYFVKRESLEIKDYASVLKDINRESSFIDVLFQHPQELLRFVAHNLQMLPQEIVKSGHLYQLPAAALFAFGLLFIGLTWSVVKRRRFKLGEIFSDKLFLVIGLGLFLKTLVTVSLFSIPSPRFIIEFLAFTFLAIVVAADRFLATPPNWLAWPLTLLLIISTPRQSNCTDCAISNESAIATKLFIEYARENPPPTKISCLSSGIYNVFLGPNYECTQVGRDPSDFPQMALGQSLRDFIQERNIQVIFASQDMGFELRDQNRSMEFKDLIENYKSMGIVSKIEVAPNQFVLVRENETQR